MEETIPSLSKANNHFALHLHKSFASEGGNVFFSPFSISTALAMLFKGARGETAREMRLVLGYDRANISDDQVPQSFDDLLTTMRENPDVYSLAIANALLIQKNFPFLSQYKEDLKKIYRAEAREVDFVEEGPKVVAEINQWVKESTKNMIHKIFDSLRPSTVMVILNAVYFKGTWERPFFPKWTISKPFYNNGLEAKVKEVPMMYIEEKFGFSNQSSFKALELPYEGRTIAMLLFLPHERNGIRNLEENLTLDLINEVKQSVHRTKVEVTLPKFHLEYTKEMNEVLKQLGMKSVFSHEANLKGLTDSERLSVSQVLHKAVVDVNEEGTEAAAITVINVEAVADFDTPSFKADHPFVFFVVDKRSDIILFMGKVEEL